MMWRWRHNGYHGQTQVAVRVPDGSEAGDVIELTEAQERRLRSSACRGSECRCGESIVTYDGYYRDGTPRPYVCLPVQGAEVRGHYPQD